MSTDWSIGDGIVVDWFNKNWPTARGNRVYFDYGTETFIRSMSLIIRNGQSDAQDYLEDKDWVTKWRWSYPKRGENASYSVRVSTRNQELKNEG